MNLEWIMLVVEMQFSWEHLYSYTNLGLIPNMMCIQLYMYCVASELQSSADYKRQLLTSLPGIVARSPTITTSQPT